MWLHESLVTGIMANAAVSTGGLPISVGLEPHLPVDLNRSPYGTDARLPVGSGTSSR